MNSASMVLAPNVTRIVRAESNRAWRSLGRFGFDREDLWQELRLRVLESEPAYDARLSSPSTFAAHVCRHRKLQLIEAATASKRGCGVAPQSLFEPVSHSGSDDDALVLLDIVSAEGCTARTGRHSRSVADPAELRLDVDRAVTNLPSELAAVANLLGAGQTVAAISKLLAVSRSTVFRRITEIRSIFRAAGLDIYVRGRVVN